MQVVVAGGGPSGSICTRTLSKAGIRTILIEAAQGAEKPCAGGIPSLLLKRYTIPDLLISQKTRGVTFEAPSGLKVNAEFPDGMFIATVRRKEFDTHLRWSAEDAGAIMVNGRVLGYEEKDKKLFIHYKGTEGEDRTTEADFLVGCDGAVSRIAKQTMGNSLPMVIGIQEEISLPAERIATLNEMCVFNYSPAVSSDYYGWIFPKGDFISIGVGTHLNNREKLNFFLERMKELHSDLLNGGKVLKRNGALIPSGRHIRYGERRVLLAGDAAGLVLPACGEGIYFAMRSGEIAAEQIIEFGQKRPDLVVSKYTDFVNREFGPIFRYFEKIERLTYKSAISREIFVRLAEDKFMADKILRAFAEKEHIPTPPFKKLAVMFRLAGMRMKVAFSISREPGFGK